MFVKVKMKSMILHDVRTTSEGMNNLLGFHFIAGGSSHDCVS